MYVRADPQKETPQMIYGSVQAGSRCLGNHNFLCARTVCDVRCRCNCNSCLSSLLRRRRRPPFSTVLSLASSEERVLLEITVDEDEDEKQRIIANSRLGQ
jgi:hypothetical protein